MTSEPTPSTFRGALVGGLTFLATVAGAYYGAAALDSVVGAAVFIIPGAILIALTRTYGPRAIAIIREWRRRIKQFDGVLKASAEAVGQADALSSKLEQLESTRADVELSSILEGRRRGIGELMAIYYKATLTPLSVAVKDGNLLIGARLEGGKLPRIGSRLLLQVRTVNEAKAILTIVELPTASEVLLGVDQILDQAFIEGMIAQASSGQSDPPSSLIISARPVRSIEELMQEGEYI